MDKKEFNEWLLFVREDMDNNGLNSSEFSDSDILEILRGCFVVNLQNPHKLLLDGMQLTDEDKSLLEEMSKDD